MFIELAEETGEVIALDEYVLMSACAQVARWRADTGRDVYASVNLSALGLEAPALDRFIASAAADAGLPPERLQLEIGCEAMFASAGRQPSVLESLREEGVRIALDHLAAAHVDPGDLDLLPLDAVKLDPAFSAAASSQRGERAVSAVVVHAESRQIDLIAKGVETEEEANALLLLGVGQGQGFAFARPAGPGPLADAAVRD